MIVEKNLVPAEGFEPPTFGLQILPKQFFILHELR